MILRLQALVGLLVLMLSACQLPESDNQVTTQITNNVEIEHISEHGDEISPFVFENKIYWILSDAQQGLTLLDEQYEKLAHWQGSVEKIDVQVSENNRIATILAIDANTTATLLLSVNLDTFSISLEKSVSAKKGDIDAICSEFKENGLSYFTTDALGQISHSHFYIKQNNKVVNHDIKNVFAGPDLSDCALHTQSKSLYVVEQDIGVWRYDSSDEAENKRTLFQLPKKMEIESISVTESGLLFLVSPDSPTIWLIDGTDVSELSLPTGMQPKVINVAELNANTVIIGLFDEKSEQLYSTIYTSPSKNKQAAIKEAQVKTISATAQTTPVNRFGDAADDPAIWVNSATPEKSLILTTDKKYGLNVYDLNGTLTQTIPVGRINNIDLRYRVTLNGEEFDIAAASNRSSNSVSLFSIAPSSGHIEHIDNFKTDLNDVYGLCMYQDSETHVIINDTSGAFRHYKVKTSPTIHLEEINRFATASQPEGCVAEDKTGRLFYGEESTGVWLRSLTDTSISPELIAKVQGSVKADIEGMGLYYVRGHAYLVVSSQGNNSYAIYDVDENNQLLLTFNITADYLNGIDGVSETDGLDTVSLPLGDKFPKGILVVQDGYNVMPMQPQNFKIVDGVKLEQLIENSQ